MQHKWLPVEELQAINERQFNKKHIDGYIRKELFEDPDCNLLDKVEQGVSLLNQWLEGEYYDSKAVRINHLKSLDMVAIVKEVFVGIMYFPEPTPMVNVVGQLASRLGFDDKRDSIQTMAEIVAVLTETDVYDINKPHPKASLYIVSNIGLPDQLAQYIERSCYLPPLVCPPKKLTHNMDTPYLTHSSDSLILGGSFNHHNEDICLDVINSRNAVPYSLDVEFLCNYEEEPTFDLNEIDVEKLQKHRKKPLTPWEKADLVRKQKQNWLRYKRQSYYFYSLMANQGNKFYFGNKVDKRGRIYTQGYHINLQGTPFKKASLNFANKEQVTGVPDEFKL